ncbi:periplasmic heavy metal sensor [uncultured Roseobacter sp.]|uniref:periplasmic heavy metal sensor n=1 Tax=uncultured Roseobacter sp. TaxID=114847 RepID=UPI002613F0C5|nr:periplasmic heavy metal sensor [uncultured Roseobacter sp.]
MTDTDKHAPEKRPDRRLKLALFASLALNLAIAGLVAGTLLRSGPDRPGGPGADSYARPYMAALPREQRREMFRGIRSANRQAIPDRGARRALYRDVLSALRTEPFDAVALETAARRQAEAGVRFLEATQTAWVQVVAGMSAQERAAYAQRVEEALSRGGRKKQ